MNDWWPAMVKNSPQMNNIYTYSPFQLNVELIEFSHIVKQQIICHKPKQL